MADVSIDQDVKRARRKRAYEKWRIKHPKLPPREPIVSAAGRLCRTCNIRKSNDAFAPDARAKDGLAWRCRECARAAHQRWSKENVEHVRDEHRKTQREMYAADPERLRQILRKSRLKTKYGLTLERLKEMLAHQNGGCAICGKELAMKALGLAKGNVACVDHDHGTGSVRGILCSHCNRAIGLLQDSPEILGMAISYLKRFEK